MFRPALRLSRHTRRSKRIAAVAALLLGGAAVAPSAQATTPGELRLRVMAYNIQAGAGSDHVFDLERQARAIESEHPDLVGLEEVDVDWAARSDYTDEAAWLARRLHMHVFFGPIYDLPPDRVGAPDRRFGVALLSRFPILHAANREITRLSTQVPDPVPALGPGFPEVLVSAHGVPLWVYVTHLDYRGEPDVREAQVADMDKIMDGRHGRKLLLGDFNAQPDDAELAPLWTRLTDAMTVAGQRTTPTWPADVPAKRIDYVTYSPGLRALDAHVPDTLASDHRPVVTDLIVRRMK
ncbi:endonuclease/exonuclease/phosphatase family protein [Actinomadura sp. DC4]|uniref:endonuclease/exonuclease/phosphatase family protein n=1 Tax=Actinomadura sp. DC4 TaxID=3055069 RepID=UPI0025AF3259|nr:endonuclease/exonuclease/phosphatase family protein [Actinomadura sp. DC4]MDN3351831.1 endonuclease/exonuclease/phosphatase family protein [Actinomadura sp. DC4]